MKKICYINQPFGLGDILICEPIARHYYNKGYTILYGVNSEYIWIKNYIKYINYIVYEDKYKDFTEEIISDEYIYLPLLLKRVSPLEEWRETGWLYDKYRISKLDPNLWKSFSFDRDYEKEESLYLDLKLKEKDYIVVNEFSSVGKRSLNISSKYDIVYMNQYKEYTMLDWCKVIENAKELHTVSTSVVFPGMYLNHPDITVYCRKYAGDGTMDSIKKVFSSFNIKYET